MDVDIEIDNDELEEFESCESDNGTEEHADNSTSNNIPQSKPMAPNQVRNNAGGFGWKVDDIVRLKRFLCLGSEGGTYYVGEKELTRENAACIQRLIDNKKGPEAVKIIRQFSVEGRTAKQNPIMLGLAICARCTEMETKRAAYAAVKDICRIPTHLFQFIEYCEKISSGTGWGRAHRKAVCAWYNQFKENPMKLAIHVTKYKMRNDWSHLDVLRLAHPKPVNRPVAFVIRYITKGLEEAKKMYSNDDPMSEDDVTKISQFLSVIEEVKSVNDEDILLDRIQNHGLVREHIPTQFLKSVKVWDNLLQGMPMTAMIRNLGKMSSIGLLSNGSDAESVVVKKLSDQKQLKYARIHPFNVLVALLTYEKGRGDKGKLSWPVNPTIQKALDKSFYMSFKFVKPTDKRYLLAVDVSGSMSMSVMGSSVINAREAATAMMMSTRRTEKTCDIVAFCDHLKPLIVSPTDTLKDVVQRTSYLPFGGTDCGLPMVHALQNKKKYDVFIVYTDCETWCGRVHPAKALRDYRKAMGIWDARLIVVGMASTQFTIADPDDPGMLDVVGFDSGAPEAMSKFITGEI